MKSGGIGGQAGPSDRYGSSRLQESPGDSGQGWEVACLSLGTHRQAVLSRFQVYRGWEDLPLPIIPYTLSSRSQLGCFLEISQPHL